MLLGTGTIKLTQWRNNKKEGKGMYKWPDGRCYQG
jgi:hypothetical protein